MIKMDFPLSIDLIYLSTTLSKSLISNAHQTALQYKALAAQCSKSIGEAGFFVDFWIFFFSQLDFFGKKKKFHLSLSHTTTIKNYKTPAWAVEVTAERQ